MRNYLQMSPLNLSNGMKQHKQALHRLAFRISLRRFSRRNRRHSYCANPRFITQFLLRPDRRARARAIIYPAAKEFAEAMSRHTGKTITAEEILDQFPFRR